MTDANSELETLAALFPEGDASSLTLFLRQVQARFNWISPEAMDLASEYFRVSYPRVYEEANLSPEFSTERRGEIVIVVCRGLSCSESGSREVFKDWGALLGLEDGATSPDGRYSLCTQHCFGRCAIGPNLKIQGDFFADQAPGMAQEHLKRLQEVRTKDPEK